MKVLLTGGSGFIAAHCLDLLLEHGHEVVTTVRSDEKGERILDSHRSTPEGRLSYVIVKDISQDGAFDQAVISTPPFKAVVHTASPFHFNLTDSKKDFLDPAINGTVGILKAIKKNAPAVKTVAITSSFAAIIDPNNHPESYDEKSWNSVTLDEAVSSQVDPVTAYRASKTFAEKAAWEFLEKEKPEFQLVSLCPPLVFGPVVHYLNSLAAINTSNERVRDLIHGKIKDKVVPAPLALWVDVRDVALAHVKAIEVPEAAGKRFFVTTGFFSNKEVADIIRKRFPQYQEQLPSEASYDDVSNPGYKFDHSRSVDILGLKYRSLDTSISDTVESLIAVEARVAENGQ